MKKSLIIFALIFATIKVYGQVPPNLLGQTIEEVKSSMSNIHAVFNGKDYTNVGKPYLKYLTDFNLTTMRNVNGDSMFGAFFNFEIENHCTKCIYMFADNSNLEKIVTSMDTDRTYSRKDDVFGWESKKANFDVIIKKNDDDKGFSFTYVWLATLREKKQ